LEDDGQDEFGDQDVSPEIGERDVNPLPIPPGKQETPTPAPAVGSLEVVNPTTDVVPFLSPSTSSSSASRLRATVLENRMVLSTGPAKDPPKEPIPDPEMEKKPTARQIAVKQLVEEKRLKALSARMSALKITAKDFPWKKAHARWERLEDKKLKVALAGTSKVFKAHVLDTLYRGTDYARAYFAHRRGLAERAHETWLASKPSPPAARKGGQCLFRSDSEASPQKEEAKEPETEKETEGEEEEAEEIL
jgi:hypothetical protein